MKETSGQRRCLGNVQDDEIRPGVLGAAVAMVALAVGIVVWIFGSVPAGAPVAEDESGSSRTRAGRRSHASQGWSEAGERAEGVVYSGQAVDLGAEYDDPQVQAYSRSFASVPDGGTGAPFVPTRHLGQVISVDGDAPIAAGASCHVRVLPVASYSFNCLISVVCDDVVIYPDSEQRAGYAPCDVEGGLVTRALDQGITSSDGDPAVDVDLAHGRVVVSDDGPAGRRFSATIGMRRI